MIEIKGLKIECSDDVLHHGEPRMFSVESINCDPSDLIALGKELPKFVKEMAGAFAEARTASDKVERESDEARYHLNKKLFGESTRDCSRIINSYPVTKKAEEKKD